MCRDTIHKVFDDSLLGITQLTREEEELGETDYERQKVLKSVKTAYEYLLKQCSSELNEIDKNSLADKV